MSFIHFRDLDVTWEFSEGNLFVYRIKPHYQIIDVKLLKSLLWEGINLVVEVEEEGSLLLVLSLLSGEGTSGSVVSGFGEGADGLVELEGFHEVESSIDGGDSVVLSNLHPGHDGPVGDGSSGEGWDGMGRREDTVLSILEKPVSESTSNQEHDGVRSETVGEDGSALEVLDDNGKLVRGSQHQEKTIVLVEWEREGVGDGGISNLVVDVHVEASLGLQLGNFLDLASLLDEKGAVSEDVGKSSGDLGLNLVEGGNDGVIISLQAFGGFFSVGLDMRESLDGVVELDPEGSLEAGGGGGADGFEGTDIVSAESINSDGTNLVESSLDVSGPAGADRSLQVGHGDGGDVLSHLGVSSGHAGKGEQQKSGPC